MLKTNSKKAAENIRNYIMNNFTPEGYTDNPPQEFPETASFILDTFRSEKYHLPQDFPECLTLVIITTVQPLTISAQSLKRRPKKKHGILKNKPRNCSQA